MNEQDDAAILQSVVDTYDYWPVCSMLQVKMQEKQKATP